MRIEIAIDDVMVGGKRGMQRERGWHALDDESSQRFAQALETAGAIRPMHDQFPRSLSGLFGFLDIVIAPAVGVAVLLGCCAMGMHALWRAGGSTAPRALAWMALLALPVAATLAANLIGSYPLGEYRLVAFLTPCLIILLALGLEHGARTLLWRCHTRTRQRCVDGLGMAAALNFYHGARIAMAVRDCGAATRRFCRRCATCAKWTP